MQYKKAIDHIIGRLENELPGKLKYHSLEHTLGVIRSSGYLASQEKIRDDDLILLKTAAAYHDSGFLNGYQAHEEASCAIVEEKLPAFGYNEKQIEIIKGMIMATKIPQSPKTKLEKILCDADLDYLGGDQYSEISKKLHDELTLNGLVIEPEKWLELQIKFLEQHHYWTDFALKVFTPVKSIVLQKLKAQSKENQAH